MSSNGPHSICIRRKSGVGYVGEYRARRPVCQERGSSDNCQSNICYDDEKRQWSFISFVVEMIFENGVIELPLQVLSSGL